MTVAEVAEVKTREPVSKQVQLKIICRAARPGILQRFYHKQLPILSEASYRDRLHFNEHQTRYEQAAAETVRDGCREYCDVFKRSQTVCAWPLDEAADLLRDRLRLDLVRPLAGWIYRTFRDWSRVGPPANLKAMFREGMTRREEESGESRLSINLALELDAELATGQAKTILQQWDQQRQFMREMREVVGRRFEESITTTKPQTPEPAIQAEPQRRTAPKKNNHHDPIRSAILQIDAKDRKAGQDKPREAENLALALDVLAESDTRLQPPSAFPRWKGCPRLWTEARKSKRGTVDPYFSRTRKGQK